MKKSLLGLALTWAITSQAWATAPQQVEWNNSTVPEGVSSISATFSGADVSSPFHALNVTGATGVAQDVHVTVQAMGPKASDQQDQPLHGVWVGVGSQIELAGSSFQVSLSTDFLGAGNNVATGFGVETNKITTANHVKVSAHTTDIDVTSLAANGKSVYGISMSASNSTLDFTGQAVNVKVSSATNRTLVPAVESNLYSEIIGVDLSNGVTTFSKDTTLTIEGQTTSEALSEVHKPDQFNYKGTSPLSGIKLEGGQGVFDGPVHMNLQAKGGRIEALAVTNYYFNTTQGNVYGKSAGHFNALTISATSQLGEVVGIDTRYTPKGAQSPSSDVILEVAGPLTLNVRSDANNAYGLMLKGASSVVLSGDVTVNAQTGAKDKKAYAIYSSGASLTLSGQHVNLTGDVYIDGQGQLTVGSEPTNTQALARVTPATTTTTATFNGAVNTSAGTLALSDANVNFMEPVVAGTVTSQGATLHLQKDATATISELTSTGTTTIVFDSAQNKTTIQNHNNADIVAQGSSTFNNQFGSAQEAAQKALAMVTSDGTQGISQKVVIEDGETNGGLVADVSNGQIDESTVVTTPNTKTEQLGQNITQNVLTWRLSMNDLQKRMGSLRDQTGQAGAWARVNAGRQSFLDADNDFVTVQVGADRAVGEREPIWMGLAFSYTYGDMTYTGGQSDNDTYALAAYASWLSDSGLYVDAIGKVGRLATRGSYTQTDVNFNTLAFAMSLEGGYRYALGTRAFIEPQVEVRYGAVGGTRFNTYNATQGLTTPTRLQTSQSWIARAGLRTGLTLWDPNTELFARASVLREMAGDVNIDRGGQTYHYESKDTWFEYGVGVNSQLSHKTRFWIEVDRTTQADVQLPWEVTVGARWSF